MSDSALTPRDAPDVPPDPRPALIQRSIEGLTATIRMGMAANPRRVWRPRIAPDSTGNWRPYSQLHPFVRGLIAVLPLAGTPWSTERQLDWLKAAASCLALMYGGSPKDIVVEARGEAKPKSETP